MPIRSPFCVSARSEKVVRSSVVTSIATPENPKREIGRKMLSGS